MNKETKDTIVKYIIATLDPVYGISKEAYNLLEELMKLDRDLASELHNHYLNISCANKTYFIYPLDPKTHIDINARHFERCDLKAEQDYE
jgi:hypothetical protein